MRDKNQKKIKILFAIAEMGVGGAERSMVNQINNINKELFDPYLCTLLPEEGESFLDSVNIKEEKKVFFDFSSYFNLKSWFSLIKWVRKEGFDVVYCNLFKANTAVRTAAFIAGVKKIIIAERNTHPKKEFSRFLVDRILSILTEKIIAVSPEVKDYLIKRGHIPVSKIEVLYNGIDLKPFSDSLFRQREKLREEFSFEEDEVIIVSVGRVIIQKSYDILLRVALQLKKTSNKKIRFVIAGNKNTELGEELERKVKEWGLQGVVDLLGVRRDIPRLLIASDIFFMPSRWEGFCIALIEAMAGGLPAVANNVGVVSSGDSIKNGTSGFIVPNLKESDFADKLLVLIENKDLREKMGRNAREISKNFSIENNLKRFQEICLE